MFARIVYVPLKPEAVGAATGYFRDSVGPTLKEQPGFKNSRFLTNPTTNEGLMVTL
jgi:hypothetical protein